MSAQRHMTIFFVMAHEARLSCGHAVAFRHDHHARHLVLGCVVFCRVCQQTQTLVAWFGPDAVGG